jgi:tyrosine-protein kinase Etk/Wzc
MRRGALHKVFGFPNKGGLSEVIAGAMPFEAAVHRNISTNFDVLTQGMIPPNPSELLMSPHFTALLAQA